MMRSRVPDAAQRLISAFTRVFDTLWAVHRGAQTQNRENNPMQSRMGPRSQRSCGLRAGHEKKNGPSSRPQPNLIPLWIVIASASEAIQNAAKQDWIASS